MDAVRPWAVWAEDEVKEEIIEFADITLVEEDVYWTYTARTYLGELVAFTVANPTDRELLDALLHAYKAQRAMDAQDRGKSKV